MVKSLIALYVVQDLQCQNSFVLKREMCALNAM